MSGFREKWKKEDIYSLNKTLVNLIGNGIGYMPLANLMDLKPYSGHLNELAELIANDGVSVKQDLSDKLWIYVK